MSYHGDVRLGDTIDIKFTTRQSTGAPTTLAGSPVISAYVGNGTTELTAGITLTVDFDSRTGLNNVRVVASSGNGYATATNVELVITTGTVNSVSVVGEVIGSFSIENRSALMPTTVARTLVVDAAGLADANAVKVGPTGSGTAQTARDIGASVLLSSGAGTGQLDFTSGVVKANATQWLGGTIPAVNVTGVPLVDAKYLLGTVFSTPTVAGIPNVNAKTWNDLTTVALPLIPTVAGRTLDCSAGGEAGLDWANVGSPTTTLALTGTTIATTQKVDIETIKTNPVVNAGTVTFPTGATLASTTNITAGTITTVTTTTTATNLTNAPTSGDFTATMKTSLNAATPASVTGAVGSVTGNVGGNVVGSVASVTAAVTLSAGDSPVMQSGTAAAGGASTITIQTALGADSLPVGATVKITSGTGAKQTRIITAYVDATKVVTVDRAWVTNPDNTSVYSIIFAELPKLDANLKVAGVVLTDTVTTYTGNTVQTGDSFARIGATGSGLTSLAASATALSTVQWTNTLATNLGTLAGHDPGTTLGTSTLTQAQVTGGAYSVQSASCVLGDARIANLDATVSSRGTSTLTQTQVTGGAYSVQSASCVLGDARVANLDAAVTTRMATYTQPTGFLAATFPATVASTTNITGGTMTTTTNVTTVNGLAANVITAASVADGAIDTATFAAGTTLPRVTLVDTTTTNTDMRGTDSALLASSYTAPDNTNIALAASNTTTLLARLGAFTGSGVNTVLGFFKALLSSAASTPSDVGGTFDPATDSTEAIRDRGDAAWTTATSVTVSDKTGFALTAAYDLAKTAAQASDIPSAATVATAVLTTAMTESYAATGVAPTLAQMQYMVWADLHAFSISGTTITAKKLDGTTTAMTHTLDSASAPTSKTRAS